MKSYLVPETGSVHSVAEGLQEILKIRNENKRINRLVFIMQELLNIKIKLDNL